MDLDLLKKLIKLANHNSNEHEANSAARRVCKMIAEDNFQLVGGDIESKPRARVDPRTAWDKVNDYMNQRYANARGGASQQQQNQSYGGGGYSQRDYNTHAAQQEAYERAYRQTQEARRKWDEERIKEQEAYKAQERARKRAREEDNTYWDRKTWTWEDVYRTDSPFWRDKRPVPCLGGCGSIKETDDKFWTCDDCTARNKQQREQLKPGKCNICGAPTMSEGITMCATCVFKRY